MLYRIYFCAATINAEKEKEEKKYFESLINSVSQNETADIQLSPVEKVLQSEYTTIFTSQVSDWLTPQGRIQVFLNQGGRYQCGIIF